MVNPIFGIGIWPMPILQLGMIYGNCTETLSQSLGTELSWGNHQSMGWNLDEAPSCDFCQSERHLAICYVSSSNRQKLFPFLLVTLPIFVGDIYNNIYIYVYIQILGVRGFGWVWCPCWWCCCCCSLSMAYPFGMVEWWFLGFWKLKWMISNKYNSYNGQNKVFQYWWDDT